MKIKIISIVLFAVFLISSISGIVKAADTDGDILDDDWEMNHFGNLDQGPDDDPDDDGYNNLQEYENDTDPNSYNDDNNDDNDNFEGGNPFEQLQSFMFIGIILVIIFMASMMTIAVASVCIFVRLGKIKKELNKLPPEPKSQEKSNKTE